MHLAVQRGTAHAWSNRSDEPATTMATLCTASRWRTSGGGGAEASPCSGGSPQPRIPVTIQEHSYQDREVS